MILIEEKNGLALIKISKPEKLNSLDTKTLNELADKVKEECSKSSVKAILLTGEGKIFSAGIDLAEIAFSETPRDAGKPFEALGNLLKTLLECGKPTATYMNGPAIAGGGEIALATDIRIADEKSYLSWPEIKWGLIAPMLAAEIENKEIPILLEKALTGDKILPDQAISLGLVNTIAKNLEEALEYVSRTIKTSTENPEAQKLYLDYYRKNKLGKLGKIKELTRLAENQELINKAKAFITKQKS